ncbi:amino acid adenylation domain-containing protein [Amycolatopsis sp. NPDC059090]|uniref:amino acid adenylation domain-containing protein n=1 Tax=Amycolatopsis sp. NPDC059090 TaxID=3346723 RepID=UPI00366CD00B
MTDALDTATAPVDVPRLVAELEGLGVELWQDESGGLRFRAPRGVLTEDRKAALRAAKPQLLDYLREAAHERAEPDPAAAGKPFPLTGVQAAYLLGRRDVIAYGRVGCHAYGELDFPDLDGDRVGEIWRALVARHGMLRAVVDADGSQRVLAEVPPLAVPVAQARDEAEFDRARERTRAELDHRVYSPGEWPLFDVRVTRGAGRATLHLSIDFLIADFVSIQVLLDEFSRLRADPDLVLPELGIGYRDYLLAERRLSGTRRYRADREYWLSRVDSLPPAPELPIRPEVRDGAPVRFARHTATLDAGRFAELSRIAGTHGVTASAAVLAAYAEVIGRWSRRRRFTLDLTVLSRLPLHEQVDRLVGDFTGILPLEVDAGAKPRFAERAAVLQDQLWADLDHRLFSGVEVLREMARRRGQDAALMPVVFTSALGLGSASSGPAAPGYGISQTPQVWIDCQVLEHAGALTVNWDVREGVFPDGVAADMFGAFADLLRGLADGERHWSAESPVPLPAAQERRRAEANATAGPLPSGLLHGEVVEQARRTPDRPAVITPAETLTYRELVGRAAAVARRLSEKGCGAGDLVAVAAETGAGQIVAVFGALLAGAAYLPIDVRQPAARQQQLVERSGARFAVVGPGAAALAGPVGLEADGSAAEPPPVTGDPDERAYVIYTSGSTGYPKGVVVTHRAAGNTVADINRRFAVTGDDRVLGVASLAFDLSVYDVFGPLSVGGALVLPEHSRRGDPSHWAELMRARRVTLWNSVPAQMQMLAEYLRVDTAAAPPLRLTLLSGDWIPVRLPGRIRELLPGAEVISLGGATEAAIWSIWHPVGEVPEDAASVPYGRPLTNQTFHVLDELGRPCPEWTVGELFIGGVGVATGYLGDEEQTRQRFGTDPAGGRRYRTGDLGRWLPSGDIEFLGREDQQVKIRGHRIELAEIESALAEHPSVGAAAVLVEGESVLDRGLAAFVEPAPRDEPEPDRLPAVLASAAAAELAAVRSEMDPSRAVSFARQLDRTALLAMVRALREQGLFATADSRHTVEEVFRTAGVTPKHERLVRRWINALEQNGMLVRDDGVLTGVPPVTAADLEQAWREVDELQPGGGQRPELVEYFHTACAHLPELLREDADPVQLLFPEGRVDIQESAYQGNFLSNSLNRLVESAVTGLAADRDGPLSLLEVGAGVGGASIDLIPALAQYDVDYLFTDVSRFFLNQARERFGEQYPWVGYGLFDLNEDYRTQGLRANSTDVILCANVLHYARDAAQALGRLRELLRPGGWLVFIETTRDNYQILTSMEFLFDAKSGDFADVRAGRDQTFISLPQWRELLAGAGADAVVQLSAGDEALDRIGMHAFAARFKSGREPAHDLDLLDDLAERLPDYMVPGRLEVLDELPLTGNGKVDRAALAKLLPDRAAPAGPVAQSRPEGELEAAVAQVWCRVLGRTEVGRDQDIFELGGDSLVAAQIVGEVKEQLPQAAGLFFDELLRDVLEGATVAELAGRLSGESDAAAPAAHSGPELVELAPGSGPRTWVVVGDGTGEPRWDPGLVSGPVSGLRPGTAPVPAPLVQRLADAYVPLLPETGEIALYGNDSGGLVALELGRRLAEAGRPPAALTVVVRSPIGYRDDEPVGYFFARTLGLDLPATPDDSEVAAALENGTPAGAAWNPSGFGPELAERFDAYQRAAREQASAEPELYTGDVTLVLDFDTDAWPSAANRVRDYWQRVCLGELAVKG